MIPKGYDPNYDLIGCPECGSQLEAELIEIETFQERIPKRSVSKLECPISTAHELESAYRALHIVNVAHVDYTEEGSCTLLSLPFWRRLGWFPVDLKYQTVDEAVHDRIRKLGYGTAGFRVSSLSHSLVEAAKKAIGDVEFGADSGQVAVAAVLETLADHYFDHGGIFGAAHIVKLRQLAAEAREYKA